MTKEKAIQIMLLMQRETLATPAGHQEITAAIEYLNRLVEAPPAKHQETSATAEGDSKQGKG